MDTSDSRFVNASTQNGTDLWQTHTIALPPFPAPLFYRINTATNARNRVVFTSQATRQMTSTHPSRPTPQVTLL